MDWIHMTTTLYRLFERQPAAGYVAGSIPFSIGLLNLLQHVHLIVGICSLLVGMSVGVITLIIQFRVLRDHPRGDKAND